MRGGMEAVYDDMPVPLGFGQFATLQSARGPMFSARSRAKLGGELPPAVVKEDKPPTHDLDQFGNEVLSSHN